MRLRLLIAGGLFLAVIAVLSGLVIFTGEDTNRNIDAQSENYNSGGLEVLPSKGDPESTSHLLQGSQPEGGLQDPQKGLQESTSGEQLQPNSGRENF